MSLALVFLGTDLVEIIGTLERSRFALRLHQQHEIILDHRSYLCTHEVSRLIFKSVPYTLDSEHH